MAISDDQYSSAWYKNMAQSLIFVYVAASLVFRPQQFTDALLTYASMLSYEFPSFFNIPNRLWPIPVGLMLYAFSKHPSRALLVYALYHVVTHKRDSHHNGSEVSRRLGGGYVGRAVQRYLNASLHTPYLEKLQALTQTGTKFVFAVHPHSMFGISTLVHFATTRLFTKERLGIDFRVLTINMNFWIPVLREYLMSRGFVCADKRTFAALLSRNISPVIVPGGAEETLFAYPGSADLIVGKRFGFVREAVRNGAWLVPVYCFGDNEAVPTMRLPKHIVKMQRVLQKWLSFATPLGLPMFKRTPIRMVVGEPLEPPTGGSFPQRVLEYHAKYKEALARLFAENLSYFGSPAEKRGEGLRFIK